MPGGNKRSYVLKKTCSYKLHVCLSTYDFLLPPGIIGLTLTLVKCFERWYEY